MTTFLIGLAILIIGGFLYGSFVERIFKPDDRQTPAVKLEDGVDYVPMSKWKNALINLLNIAGTGPIFGPIQGILFGPVAFLTIPIGCVISGAVHDYLSGMMSLRQDGAQMPGIVHKFLGGKVYQVYNIFLCLLMLLVGAVSDRQDHWKDLPDLWSNPSAFSSRGILWYFRPRISTG